jgi:membrane-bound lytic murein transglycosylase D
MSMTTMRHAARRRLNALVRWSSGAALYGAVGITALNTPQQHHPIVPSAAAARPSSSSGPSELADIQNPRVDKWVARLSGSVTSILSRGRGYVDMISQKLSERHMPHGLVYLAMIESNLKPEARSPASAAGLWQFMAATARHFGLNVGNGSDERMDPSKSTDAALTYLSQLHDRFGSWYLAAAAYNAGPGTISRALRQVTGQTTGTDADFYRISPALPAETRDYVPKLIAAARVAKLQSPT